MIEKQKIIADLSSCIAASTLLCVRAVSWVYRIRTYTFSLWQRIYSPSPSPIWILPNKAESIGIEPWLLHPPLFSRQVVHQWTLLSKICGRQWNRTITAFTRNLLAGCRNKPIFAYLPFCSDKEIRTLTNQFLKLMPLPIGLHRCCTPKQIRTATCTDFKSVASAVGLLECLYHLSDSNRYYLVPKTNASSNWAKMVNKKASRSESGGFSKFFVWLKFNQYKISCRLLLNNLTIRDYIDFCLPLWAQIYKHKFIVQIKSYKILEAVKPKWSGSLAHNAVALCRGKNAAANKVKFLPLHKTICWQKYGQISKQFKNIKMNIITNADVKKFLTLVQAGMKNGKQKTLKNYTSGSTYDGTNVVKDYYVSLEFSFHIDKEIIDSFFVEDDFDLSNQVNDLMKGL